MSNMRHHRSLHSYHCRCAATAQTNGLTLTLAINVRHVVTSLWPVKCNHQRSQSDQGRDWTLSNTMKLYCNTVLTCGTAWLGVNFQGYGQIAENQDNWNRRHITQNKVKYSSPMWRHSYFACLRPGQLHIRHNQQMPTKDYQYNPSRQNSE